MKRPKNHHYQGREAARGAASISHRIIISSAIKAVFQEPEVRAELTTTQLARVDSICAQTEPCDEDFRYLTRRLNAAYCADD
jgi:hypothetical protein